MIHAITLPCGEEVYWNTVNANFTDKNWEVRFKAGLICLLTFYYLHIL